MAYFYKGLPIQTPLSIVSNRQAYEVETLSLKRTTFLTDAQRWELSFSVLTNGNEAQIFAAHTVDYYKRETMIMPQLVSVLKTFSFVGTLRSSASHAAGSDTVVCASSSQTGTAVIPAGTFITFAGHSKVYVTTAPVTFGNNATGVNLEIFPNLVESVGNNELVNFGDNCLLTYKRDLSSGQGISFADGILSSPGAIKLIESL